MIHLHPIRVYYEDTDLAGIVYYANYLKFIERGWSEAVRALGVDQAALKAQAGIVFAVRRVEADYLLPARFDDQLLVETEIAVIKGATIEMDQRVLRIDTLLFSAKVRLVCLGPGDKATRIPADIRQKLVTQPLTLRRPPNQPCDIDKSDAGRDYLFRSGNCRQLFQSRIGNGDIADIRLNRTEREICSLCGRRPGQRIE